MTNADMIRKMSDEELGEKLGGSICDLVPEEICLCGKRECFSCILDWLKQEADND